MELDEYKSILKVRAVRPSHETAPDLEKIRRARSRSVVQKIQSNLWLETAFALVFFALACYMAIFSGSGHLQAFSMFMLAYCVCFLYYLSKLYGQIKKHAAASSVRAGLEALIGITKRFTVLYFQLTMIMIPVILALGFLIGYPAGEMFSEKWLSRFPPSTLRIYFGASLAWMGLMYFFTRWYIKKLYGDHLANLSDQLQELKNGQ